MDQRRSNSFVQVCWFCPTLLLYFTTLNAAAVYGAFWGSSLSSSQPGRCVLIFVGSLSKIYLNCFVFVFLQIAKPALHSFSASKPVLRLSCQQATERAGPNRRPRRSIPSPSARPTAAAAAAARVNPRSFVDEPSVAGEPRPLRDGLQRDEAGIGRRQLLLVLLKGPSERISLGNWTPAEQVSEIKVRGIIIQKQQITEGERERETK